MIWHALSVYTYISYCEVLISYMFISWILCCYYVANTYIYFYLYKHDSRLVM